jgi:phosphatidate cytidylyltransferase
MLKQRVLTALAMLAILLPTLFYATPWPFCLLALVFIAAGAWEWGRLNGLGASGAIWAACQFVILAAMTWYLGLLERQLTTLWIIASGMWVLIGSWLLKTGVSGWSKIPSNLRRMGGVLALWLAWLAVSQARIMGINFLMSVLVLVWAADIFAYFTGKALGGKFITRKLAPGISPGKSWEGVGGGVVGVLLLAFVWIVADAHWHNAVPSLYTRLSSQHWILMLIALLFLTAMSVAGDLVESLIKRSAGVKDSSGLLPGHGGVLDRIDALLPTLPIAMMLVGLIL